jgi:prepilin-type N-terminal cleavage/methylation domain-containing protein
MKKGGFTLIELLIVIMIIGILAGFVVISLINSKELANDARRKADINQINKVLAIKKVNNNGLPQSAPCNIGEGCSAQVMEVLQKVSSMRDPSGKYYTYSSDGADYVVGAEMSDGSNYYFQSSTGKYSSSESVPVPGGGLCGIADKSAYYDAPTEGLCTFGTPSSLDGNGPWSWSCNGTTIDNCSALKKSDGICGNANNKEYNYLDNSYGSDTICSVGVPFSFPDFPLPGGNSNWTCEGQNGGLSPSCTSSRVGLSGYSKRKSISVSSSSPATDYQVKLDVVYDNDMQADFDDLRFTSSDGKTILNHWVESKIDSNSSVVWVKIPNLVSGGNTIYMYYGNSLANSISSGDNTFSFFDDFNSGSVNFSKWSVTGSPTISNGVLYINNGQGISQKNPSPMPVILEVKYQRPSCNRNRTASYPSVAGGFGGDFTPSLYFSGWLATTLSSNTWYLFRHIYDSSSGSGNFYWKINNYGGAEIFSVASTYTGTSAYLNYQGTESVDSQLRLDFTRARKYLAVGPTITIGSEE